MMKKYQISIKKNTNNGNIEMIWMHVDEEKLVYLLIGITNALIGELDDRHE